MNTELIALRDQITEVDNEILEILERRMALAMDIKEVKSENNLPIEDLSREEEIIKKRQIHTSLEKNFVEEIFKIIFKESKRLQNLK